MSYPSGAADIVAAGVKSRMVQGKYEPEGHDPVSDVERYPEPDDQPDPRAQWDEIRGVWEVWNDQIQTWEPIGDALADERGTPSASPAGRHGAGEAADETLPDAHRFPEPEAQPDPHAQWNEIEGVWELWDDTAQTWVDLGQPLAPGVGPVVEQKPPPPSLSPPPPPVVAPRTPPPPAPVVEPPLVVAPRLSPPPPPPPVVTQDPAPPPSAPPAPVVEPPPVAVEQNSPSTPRSSGGTIQNSLPDGDNDQQPWMKPDPYAQWDSDERIWRVWDSGRGEWVPWESP